MFIITDAAGEYLITVLERAKASEDTAVRIRVHDDDALSPVLDTPRPGDESFDHQGRLVLVLDARARDYLGDTMLDIEETPDGPKLLVLH